MKKIFLIIILGTLLFPLVSFAGTYTADGKTVTYEGIVPCGKEVRVNGGTEYVSCQFCHIFVMIERIIDFVLFSIVFPMAILLLVFGGFLFILRAEDPGNVEKGKKILTSVAIGLVIIFAAWLIINTFFVFIGLSDFGLALTGPNQWFKINCPLGAFAEIIGVRVQDINRQIWFNWDNGIWGPTGEPKVKSGTNNLYVAFWAVNGGGVGSNFTMRLIERDTGRVLASKTQWVGSGEGFGIEWWDATMPTSPYPLTLEVTPGSSMPITINPLGTTGNITGIRIQDIDRQIWFEWDNGVWGSTGEPSVKPDTNNLYVAFWADNVGGVSGNLTLRLIEKDSGNVLASKTAWADANGGVGIEWTGTMPTDPYRLTLEVTPGSSINITINALTFGEITAIRVQDIAHYIWFSWDNGVWNPSPPSIEPGANHLYVAFWAENKGGAGDLTLRLIETDTGRLLTSKKVGVEVGGGVGIEWTGTMPTRPYNLTLQVTPGHSIPITINPLSAEVNGEITAIRVQDIARQIWFEWDNSVWSPSSPSVQAGANNLYVAFWAMNRGNTSGNLTLKLIETNTGNVLASKTASAGVGDGVGIEWTGTMPSSSYNLTLEVTPGSSINITINLFTPPPPQPSGQITAIRVQDIARNIWFNWDNGVWSPSSPSIRAGANNLYVAFWAENKGSASGNLTLRLIETNTGKVLTSKTAWAAVGGGVGIEWTGTMPASSYPLTLQVTPGSSMSITINRF